MKKDKDKLKDIIDYEENLEPDKDRKNFFKHDYPKGEEDAPSDGGGE